MSLDERKPDHTHTSAVPARPPPWATICPSGDIDLTTAAALVDRVIAASSNGGRDVVVDFANVTFVDVASVRALIEARTAVNAAGHELVVRRPSRLLVLILGLFGVADMRERHDGSPDGS